MGSHRLHLDHWTFAEVCPINKMDKALQELADNWDEYEEIRLDPGKYFPTSQQFDERNGFESSQNVCYPRKDRSFAFTG